MILVLPGFPATLLEAARWPAGRVRRVAPILGAPEAAYVGLPPTRLADGPLVVAALGIEPPERTLQFRLSWTGLEDGRVVAAEGPTPAESAVLKGLLPKLDTKLLTGLFGAGKDHALVMEGFHDLGTTPLADALGRPLGEVLPEGEKEEALRRYIDDSANLLSDLESNRRRLDEGRPRLNLLFPWGHGAPRRLPNLALRRGEPLRVEAASLRTRGLARLVGYRPVALADGRETDWKALAARAPEIAVVEAFGTLPQDEAEWALREMARGLLATPDLVLVVGDLLLETGAKGEIPLREDVAHDRTVPQTDLWEAIDAVLSPGRVSE